MVETNSAGQIEQAIETSVNVYEYNYSHIEPIAMVDKLPQSESFSKPWLVEIAKQAINLAINTLVANRGDQGQQGVEDDVRDFLRQTLYQTLEDQGPALKLKLVGALIGFLPEMLLRDALAEKAAAENLAVKPMALSNAPASTTTSVASADQVAEGIDTALEQLLEGLPPAAMPVAPAALPANADLEAAKGVDIAAEQLSQGLPAATTEVKILQGLPPNAAAVEVAKGIEASVLLQSSIGQADGQASSQAAISAAARGAEAAVMLRSAPSAAVKTQVSSGVETALQRLMQNVPAKPSEIEQFMSSNLVKVLGSDLIRPFASRLLDGLKEKAPTGRPQQLADYEQLFTYIQRPQVAASLYADEMFAWLRVAGPNPLMITQMTTTDPRFPVTEAQYQTVMGEPDSLELALRDGRLYLADYGILDGALGGTFGTQPQVQKYLYAPLALFAVPLAGGLMRPVAIQAGQNPAEHPVVTPAAPEAAWLIAKTIVQIADANFHEGVSHFARTHLLIEPFVMATHRRLPAEHPLSRLLLPHFQGTLAINNAAKGFLVSPLGGVNQLLSATIDNSRVLIVKGFLGRGFNADMLPQRLKDRGVADQTSLPVYPYRDDGLLIWNAIQDWVTAYLGLYYGSDTAVQHDARLQAWASELVAFDGGRLPDFGNTGTGEITTLAYLIEAVTMVIFTASAQHAAVNFPQNSVMSFAPIMPTAGYAPVQSDIETASFSDWLDLLPPLEQAQAQLNLLYLLGSVYFTRLGEYEPQQFADPQVSEPLRMFQQRLQGIAQTIDQRNAERPWAYDHLKPVNIPQSINI